MSHVVCDEGFFTCALEQSVVFGQPQVMFCFSFVRASFEWATCKLAVQAIGVLMRSRVALTQQVSHIHPYGHFDTLQRIQCQQTEFLIENVQLNHILKAAARDKTVVAYGAILPG